MVKDRPALFYTLALATGVLLYARWPFLAGVLDLLTVAVATVLVVAAILLVRPKGRYTNGLLMLSIAIVGILCGIMITAVNGREEEHNEPGWKNNIEAGQRSGETHPTPPAPRTAGPSQRP